MFSFSHQLWSLALLCFHNWTRVNNPPRYFKQNSIMSANSISSKIPHSWYKLTWHPWASTKSHCNVKWLPGTEHLSTCGCCVGEGRSAAWLTFDVPFDLAAVLQAQSLVQLLQNHFQFADLRGAGQRYLLDRQVHTGQTGWRNQEMIMCKVIAVWQDLCSWYSSWQLSGERRQEPLVSFPHNS